MKECKVRITDTLGCLDTESCFVSGIASRAVSFAESVSDIDSAAEFARQYPNCPFFEQVITGIANCRVRARNEARFGNKLNPETNPVLDTTRTVGSSIQIAIPKE